MLKHIVAYFFNDWQHFLWRICVDIYADDIVHVLRFSACYAQSNIAFSCRGQFTIELRFYIMASRIQTDPHFCVVRVKSSDDVVVPFHRTRCESV